MVNTLCASIAGGTGSIPGWATKIPHAMWCRMKNEVLFWRFQINRITQYLAFHTQLLSLSITFSRFIYVVACVITSLLFVAKCVIWIHI